MNLHVNDAMAASNLIVTDKSICGWRWLQHGDGEAPFWLQPYVTADGHPCVAAHRNRETAGDHSAAEMHLSLDALTEVNLRRAYMIVG